MTFLPPTLQVLYDVIPCHYISLSSYSDNLRVLHPLYLGTCIDSIDRTQPPYHIKLSNLVLERLSHCYTLPNTFIVFDKFLAVPCQ